MGADDDADAPGKAPAAAADTERATIAERAVAAARRARPSVVRIFWRNMFDRDDAHERNAVVVSAAGHLLIAGPVPDTDRGRLTAEIPPGKTYVKADFVATDPASGLTLLYVNAPGLQPIQLAPEPPGADATPPPSEVDPDAPASAPTPDLTSRPASAPYAAPAPLGSLDVGLEVILVSGDGGVAYGRVRAQDRPMDVIDPHTGIPQLVSGLVEASLASLPSDLGSPWVDADGRLLALQMATGLARSLPEDVRRAERAGLTQRPHPTASRAVPVSVVRIVLPLLMRARQVARAGLGIRSEPGSEAIRAQLCADFGCHLVTAVDSDGPGARASLEVNDLIVTIQGQRLRPGASLRDLLLPFRPGDRIRLGVLREGQSLNLGATLGHWRR